MCRICQEQRSLHRRRPREHGQMHSLGINVSQTRVNQRVKFTYQPRTIHIPHMRHLHVVVLRRVRTGSTYQNALARHRRHHHVGRMTHLESHDTSVRIPQACIMVPCFWTGQTCTTPGTWTPSGHIQRLIKHMVAPTGLCTILMVARVGACTANQEEARTTRPKGRWVFRDQKQFQRMFQGAMLRCFLALPLVLTRER